jgi:hypothetical protein
MNFAEVEGSLPNGLHDAEVLKVEVDYRSKTVAALVDLWVGSLSEAEAKRELYQRAVLEFRGVEYFAIDLPDVRYPYETATFRRVNPAEPSTSSPVPKNERAFRVRLFVSEHNAFMHICASDVRVVLNGEPVPHERT